MGIAARTEPLARTILPFPRVLEKSATMYMGGGQDHNDVVIRKPGSRPGSAAAKKPSSVNQALRSGGQVETIKKYNAGGNSQRSASGNIGKIDDEDEELSHQKVGTELKKLIIQGRTAKKMSQSALAQAINEKPQVIQEYESGKAIPNNQILGKLERALGVKLRGKK